MPSYRFPLARGVAEIRERGSRFRAVVEPAGDEAEAQAALEASRRRDPGATHHCWAWRLGPDPSERSSDDGEPAGTAGVPMLQVLRGAELSDVVAVVTRWFGGTKLGKGGLARAYAEAVQEALAEVEVGERQPTVEIAVEVPYEGLGAVKRLVHPPEVEIAEESYDQRVFLRLIVREDKAAALRERLASSKAFLID